MSHGTFLFFAGLAAIILVSRLAGWSGLYGPSPRAVWFHQVVWFHRFVYFALTATALLFLLGLSWEVMQAELWAPKYMFLPWLGFGNGASLFGGMAAGLVALGLLQVLARSEESTDKIVAGLVVSAPAIAVGAFYLLSVPGAQQSLGLSSVKGLGVELAFVAQAPVASGHSNESLPPGQNSLAQNPASQYWQLTDMTLASGTSKDKPFADRPFFDREAGYLSELHKIRIENDRSGVSAKPRPVEMAIERQRDLLQALSDIVQCGHAFRTMFPSPAALERRIAPALELLIQADSEFMNLSDIIAERSTATLAASAFKLHALEQAMNTSANDIMAEFTKSLFHDATQQPNDPKLAESYTVCHKTINIHFKLPPENAEPKFDRSFAWTPPYISIFVAHLLATVGHYEAALDVLNSWLKRHPLSNEPANDDPTGGPVTWFQDTVAVQFTALQGEALASIVYDNVSRNALHKTLQQLRQHLKIELDTEGAACNAVAVPLSEKAAIHSRLVVVINSVVSRYVHAVVDTRSGRLDTAVGPAHNRLARQLIELGRKCLPEENQENRLARQSISLAEGGRVLARWAIDGEKAGFLVGADIKETRQMAHDALLDAMPLFSQIQELEAKERPDDGTFEISRSSWDAMSRLVDQEVTGLNELVHQ